MPVSQGVTPKAHPVWRAPLPGTVEVLSYPIEAATENLQGILRTALDGCLTWVERSLGKAYFVALERQEYMEKHE